MKTNPDFYVIGVRDVVGTVTRTVCRSTMDSIRLDGTFDGVPWYFEGHANRLFEWAEEFGFKHFCKPYFFEDLPMVSEHTRRSDPYREPPVSNRPVSELNDLEVRHKALGDRVTKVEKQLRDHDHSLITGDVIL